MGGDPTTFVALRPRLRPAVPRRSTPARSSSTSASSRSRRPRTAGPPPARRSARPRPAGPAAPSRSTSTSPAATRPAAALQQVAGERGGGHRRPDQGRLPGPRRPERLDRRRPARGLEGRSTGPSPRPRPATSRTAPGSTADMAHPTRTGDLVVFALPAVPVRRGDAGHARRALGTSSASTATCPTSRTSPPTSTCGRPSSPAATASPRAR